MLIDEKTTLVRQRRVRCFVVDYDRLLPNGWPLLTPVEDYMPRRSKRGYANYVDRARVLKLLSKGLRQWQIAERLGCHQSTISTIRADAAGPAQRRDGAPCVPIVLATGRVARY